MNYTLPDFRASLVCVSCHFPAENDFLRLKSPFYVSSSLSNTRFVWLQLSQLSCVDSVRPRETELPLPLTRGLHGDAHGRVGRSRRNMWDCKDVTEWGRVDSQTHDVTEVHRHPMHLGYSIDIQWRLATVR
ncbi:hypothetical protein XU18_1982 [Perkinsela sp. CCAP 1560/4]|nr:hypothetical protein XU18_1982 [Perkinsela sp. CCAP 1560/4]|eukprot:KNH07450.1 hypothetical protein XU18_1982 [Perkinsela sp. CCAP 1560/4]